MVTRPPPQPQWDYFPEGMGRPPAFSDKQIKQFASKLALTNRPLIRPETRAMLFTRAVYEACFLGQLRTLLTQLSQSIEIFKYTDSEIDRSKISTGYSLPPKEVLAAVKAIRKTTDRLQKQLAEADSFTRAELGFAYGQFSEQYRNDLAAVRRLYENLTVAQHRLSKKPPEESGTYATRVGRFAAFRLIEMYEDFPRPGPRLSRYLWNCRPFVLSGLELLFPNFTETQRRTALRYGLRDRRAEAKEAAKGNPAYEIPYHHPPEHIREWWWNKS